MKTIVGSEDVKENIDPPFSLIKGNTLSFSGQISLKIIESLKIRQ